MDALGLPTPSTIFDTLNSAVTITAAIEAGVAKFGTKVTIGELIGAGYLSDQLVGLAAVSASYYAGALVGSTAVALGQVLGNGTSIADVFIDWTSVDQAKQKLNNYSIEDYWPSGYATEYSAAVNYVNNEMYFGDAFGGCDISGGFGTYFSSSFNDGGSGIEIPNTESVHAAPVSTDLSLFESPTLFQSDDVYLTPGAEIQIVGSLDLPPTLALL